VLNNVDVAPLAAMAGALAGEVTGTVSLSATASGAWQGDEAMVAFANLQAVDVNVGGVLATLATPSRMAWQSQQLSVDEVDLAVGSGRLRASGTWSERTDARFEGTFTGEVDDALRMARAFGVPASVDATGALTMAFRSTGQGRTSSTLTVRNGTLATAGQPPPLTGLEVDATLDGDALAVSRLSGMLAAEKATGTFSLSATATVPSFDLAAIDGALSFDSASFTAGGVPVVPQRPSRLSLRQGRLSLDEVAWLAAGAPVDVSGGINLARTIHPSISH
jgi:autotransporter translocation and assembly factor TamB